MARRPFVWTEPWGATVTLPAPVVFQGATRVAVGAIDDHGRTRIVRAAVVALEASRAGWSVVATDALAGTLELTREPIEGLDPEARSKDRKTRDVVTPVVVSSVALRMRRGDQRAVAIWYDGAFAVALAWSGVEHIRKLGVTALRAYLAAQSGTVTP